MAFCRRKNKLITNFICKRGEKSPIILIYLLYGKMINGLAFLWNKIITMFVLVRRAIKVLNWYLWLHYIILRVVTPVDWHKSKMISNVKDLIYIKCGRSWKFSLDSSSSRFKECEGEIERKMWPTKAQWYLDYCQIALNRRIWYTVTE